MTALDRRQRNNLLNTLERLVSRFKLSIDVYIRGERADSIDELEKIVNHYETYAEGLGMLHPHRFNWKEYGKMQ